jgi:hypothetical protein
VDHLDEVSGARFAAMKEAFLGRAAPVLPSGGAGQVAATGRYGAKDRVEVVDGFVLAADHQAVAALEAPHASAGATVDVVDALRFELARAAPVVAVKAL